MTFSIDFSSSRATLSRRPLLLDALGVPSQGAWSIRRLTKAYGGNALRIRRNTDNAEQDIGFAGHTLDLATLTAFVGSGDAFVTLWYDQSGNARHLAQTTVANQPKIAQGGNFLGGIRPDPATTQRLGIIHSAFAFQAGAATVSSFLRETEIGNSALGAIWQVGSAAGNRIWMGTAPLGRELMIRNSSNITSVPVRTLNPSGNIVTFVKTAAADVSACQTRVNGNDGSTYPPQIIGAGDNLFGINQNGNASACGSHVHRELIAWNLVLNATQLQKLERHQAAFYGITLA